MLLMLWKGVKLCKNRSILFEKIVDLEVVLKMMIKTGDGDLEEASGHHTPKLDSSGEHLIIKSIN